MRGEILFGLSMAVFGAITISNLMAASVNVTQTLAGVGFILAGVLFMSIPFTEFGDIYTGPIVWLITWDIVWYIGAISMCVASVFIL